MLPLASLKIVFWDDKRLTLEAARRLRHWLAVNVLHRRKTQGHSHRRCCLNRICVKRPNSRETEHRGFFLERWWAYRLNSLSHDIDMREGRCQYRGLMDGRNFQGVRQRHGQSRLSGLGFFSRLQFLGLQRSN
jgi:hypothetical protein